MKQLVVALACGLLFGAGLAISGMTDTRIVLGFLDLAGDWNPALAFVMGSALAVTLPGFYFTRKRSAPLLDDRFHLPAKTSADVQVLAGSALFGTGWGLYGYCPGPALSSLATLDWQPLLFVAAMSVGMAAEHYLRR